MKISSRTCGTLPSFQTCIAGSLQSHGQTYMKVVPASQILLGLFPCMEFVPFLRQSVCHQWWMGDASCLFLGYHRVEKPKPLSLLKIEKDLLQSENGLRGQEKWHTAACLAVRVWAVSFQTFPGFFPPCICNREDKPNDLWPPLIPLFCEGGTEICSPEEAVGLYVQKAQGSRKATPFCSFHKVQEKAGPELCT